MNELKITLVQPDLAWEDVNANIHHLNNLLIRVEDTHIIVLPEMFSTAFSMKAESLATDSYEKGIVFMRKVASRKECVVCGSLICPEDGKYYNRFVWVEPKGDIKFYNKRHLFTMGDEANHYTKGMDPVVIEYEGWRIKPLICYDLRFPVWSRNTKEDPYDILMYVANWPEKRIVQWNKLLQARAIENSSYVIGVNRIGVDGNGYKYTGHSMSVDYRGDANILPENVEEVKTITINKSALDEYRIEFPVLNDADGFRVES